MKAFMEYVFGTGDLAYVAAGVLFITVGAVLMAFLRGWRGMKRNRATPDTFYWKLLLADKWGELVAGWVLAGICIRFATEFGVSQWIQVEGTFALCFLLGFFSFMLANWLMKKIPGAK